MFQVFSLSRALIVLLIVLQVYGATGCSPVVLKSQEVNPVIAGTTSLGDNLSAFEASFGKGENRYGVYYFQGDKIRVVFNFGRATNVNFQPAHMPVEKILTALADFLPADYEIVSSQPGKNFIRARSVKLAGAFNITTLKWLKRGGFTISYTTDSFGAVVRANLTI